MSESPDHILALFDPSKYVAAWELDGKDVTVTIARVVGEEVIGEDGKKSHKPIIYFLDWPKPLCPGKRIVKQLIEMFDVVAPRDFAGKRFTMFPTEEKIKGELLDVVRIRKRVPPPASAPSGSQRPVKTVAERVTGFVSALKKAATAKEVEELWQSAPADKLRADVDPETLDTITLEYEARLSALEAL